jgi:PAS domain-containing protein
VGKGDYEYTIPFYGERKPILVDLVMQPDEEIETQYKSIRREGNILFGENYVPCLRGEPRFLFGTAARLRDHEGNIVGAIESIRDITAQKKLEEALRKSEEN